MKRLLTAALSLALLGSAPAKATTFEQALNNLPAAPAPLNPECQTIANGIITSIHAAQSVIARINAMPAVKGYEDVADAGKAHAINQIIADVQRAVTELAPVAKLQCKDINRFYEVLNAEFHFM